MNEPQNIWVEKFHTAYDRIVGLENRIKSLESIISQALGWNLVSRDVYLKDINDIYKQLKKTTKKDKRK